jgi:hypothetical protein
MVAFRNGGHVFPRFFGAVRRFPGGPSRAAARSRSFFTAARSSEYSSSCIEVKQLSERQMPRGSLFQALDTHRSHGLSLDFVQSEDVGHFYVVGDDSLTIKSEKFRACHNGIAAVCEVGQWDNSSSMATRRYAAGAGDAPITSATTVSTGSAPFRSARDPRLRAP